MDRETLRTIGAVLLLAMISVLVGLFVFGGMP
jgi:hypothetical protein